MRTHARTCTFSRTDAYRYACTYGPMCTPVRMSAWTKNFACKNNIQIYFGIFHI